MSVNVRSSLKPIFFCVADHDPLASETFSWIRIRGYVRSRIRNCQFQIRIWADRGKISKKKLIRLKIVHIVIKSCCLKFEIVDFAILTRDEYLGKKFVKKKFHLAGSEYDF